MKYCKMCGCLMDDTHELDICEVCLDDMDEDRKRIIKSLNFIRHNSVYGLNPDYVKALEEDKTC